MTAAPNAGPPGRLVFTTTQLEVNEGEDIVTIEVERRDGFAGTLTVEALTVADTATAGEDYEARVGEDAEVSLTDGQTHASFNVTILDDDIYEEPDEELVVTLESEELRILIRDNGDAGHFQLRDAVVNVAEDVEGGAAAVTVIRIGGSSGAAEVLWTTEDASATGGADFSAPASPQTLEFADGQTEAVLTVPVTNDDVYEHGDESFVVRLTSIATPAGATFDAGLTTTINIQDDGDSSVPGVPPPPAQYLSSGGRIELTLEAPLDTGATAIAGADLVMSLYSVGEDGATLTLVEQGPPGVFVVYGLQASRLYGFKARASNVEGDGPLSGLGSASTSSASAPTPPPAPTEVATTGGSISVSWSAPLDAGGVALVGYELRMGAVDDQDAVVEGSWSTVLTTAGLEVSNNKRSPPSVV